MSVSPPLFCNHPPPYPWVVELYSVVEFVAY